MSPYSIGGRSLRCARRWRRAAVEFVMRRRPTRSQALAALTLIALLGGVSAASAESPLNPSKSMRDNLLALATAKQVVTVVLSNGKDYRARVGVVGDEAVVLTGIAGREFFDVLIDLDEIVAIEAQARQQ